mmetsp:Transcript_75648/g.219715  ORF Transcript_75648/g.219715 Transcript_75648/m.219715 type:complete len:351 (+) Transcript_75648:46-1098(+)|eukprot:CAMPEP_0176080780 /NCGR_PEP_ID=MMETSP0120_2-20121206/40407_1 /TAXON_ID=160619 /ORGANISM="Kryptoperidinium foliaceum, Strain CCMP 1326" /LENGTH=350 /DNA_ID=CAMNT_0017414547 /DNA_START=46 /DNA_END=1098 /DNA_ORIENTATION=+
MKLPIAALLFLAAQGCSGYSFTQPMRVAVPTVAKRSYTWSMISDGSDRSERKSLDISKTTYTALVKSPRDAYRAFAEKGMSNAKMHWLKILHQSILGGAYVGFGGLLALSVAGNISGIGFTNPGLVKMTFAALFPVNLLLILMTGGQLFTGNSSTVAAAKFERMVYWRELWKSFGVSLLGNVIGCVLFAYTANYIGLLKGGTGALASSTAVAKCSGTFGQTMVKAILCNWMVSLAVFMAGASNDLAGKLIGCWFPISTFVAIGLEHSIANLFIMPCALLLGAKITLQDAIVKNLIPVVIGNAIAGAFVVAGSYSYQFGNLGKKSRERFREYLAKYEIRKRNETPEAVAFE